MLERGEELEWVPPHMKYRYDNWVSGLNGDWLISRQRFFGVPFPVWYALDCRGRARLRPTHPGSEDQLPVDPAPRCRRASPRPSEASRVGSWPIRT